MDVFVIDSIERVCLCTRKDLSDQKYLLVQRSIQHIITIVPLTSTL